MSSPPFPLRSSAFAVPPLQFPKLPLHRLFADLSWLTIVAQSSLSHLAIHPWANTIAGLRLQSTLGQNLIAGFHSPSTLEQISLQDFARNPPLGKPHCRTSLAIHLWANLIPELNLQSTFGQLDLSLTDPQSPHVPLHSELLPFTLSILPPPQPSNCY